ncbi:expressed unknown protein [Ectocarpus siliculosus]|uniref:Uncharacterized protein n=1 Tax=Ectocarpus siliculosus TaxID=2880 RepID=D7FKP2_ECTSI|nr:expressed unknown protein [Ectocarpus siliculosus]|eukprot:CBJ29441.1 expressed unknown protein [Ectocarpus siliculosus]
MLPSSAPPPPPPPTPPPPTPFNDWCQEATPSSSNQLVVLEDPTGGNIQRASKGKVDTLHVERGGVTEPAALLVEAICVVCVY